MSEDIVKPSKKELIDMLDQMVENIEKLPVYAMTSPITNYDQCALMILLSALFKAEDK